MPKRVQSIVPWRTTEEFKKVYEYLYSDVISNKWWAVEQIGVWQSRCWPSLPGAVEVCQLLTKAAIHDSLYENQKSLYRAREIEMMYGMGIVRFVNAAIEKTQSDNGQHTLSDLAEKYNIPPWIVSVRHDASHGLFPTLPVLRMACDNILVYYRNVFWEPECSRVSPIVIEYDENKTIVLIEKYRAIQHELINDRQKTNLSCKLRKKIMVKFNEMLCEPESKRKFLETLTHPDHCVTKEDVNLILASDDFVKDKSQYVNLPEALQKFWNPLIELLHRHGCISMFLEQLQLSQEKRKIKIFQKVVDYLVIYILDMRRSIAPPSSLKAYFTKKAPMINFKRLLFCCMKGSSRYSKVVFERILEEFPLGSWKNELSMLLSIKQGFTIEKENQNKAIKKPPLKRKKDLDFTFTVADMEEDLNSIMKKKKKPNPWNSPSITLDFSMEPLGSVHHPCDKKDDLLKAELESAEINESFKKPISEVYDDVEMTVVVEEPTPPKPFFKDLTGETFTIVYTRRHKNLT